MKLKGISDKVLAQIASRLSAAQESNNSDVFYNAMVSLQKGINVDALSRTGYDLLMRLIEDLDHLSAGEYDATSEEDIWWKDLYK
jgi:hypothetical protein